MWSLMLLQQRVVDHLQSLSLQLLKSIMSRMRAPAGEAEVAVAAAAAAAAAAALLAAQAAVAPAVERY